MNPQKDQQGLGGTYTLHIGFGKLCVFVDKSNNSVQSLHMYNTIAQSTNHHCGSDIVMCVASLKFFNTIILDLYI